MKQSQNQLLPMLGLEILCLAFSACLDAVPVDTLRAPMQAMKKEVWAEKLSNDNALQNKRLENLEKTLETLIKVNQGLALQQAKQQLAP